MLVGGVLHHRHIVTFDVIVGGDGPVTLTRVVTALLPLFALHCDRRLETLSLHFGSHTDTLSKHLSCRFWLLDLVSQVLFEFLQRYIIVLGLLGYQPGQGLFVSISFALLVGHVIAVVRLLVELGQAVSGLLEAVLEGLEVHVSAAVECVMVLHLEWQRLVLGVVAEATSLHLLAN